MFGLLSRWAKGFREWLGIGQDVWDILMILTLGSAAAVLQTYLSWGKEHAYAVFLFAIIAFAMACIVGCSVLWVADRQRIRGRLKMQQIVPHFAERNQDKIALTPRLRIVNRSNVTVGWVLKAVHFQVGQQSSQTAPEKETVTITLPNDHGWVLVQTIPGIPLQNQTKGNVYLDIHYGVEGQDRIYRMEYRTEIDVAISGHEILITPFGSQVTHSRLERPTR